jgi:transcriptional regulator with XRE-family HTH domain
MPSKTPSASLRQCFAVNVRQVRTDLKISQERLAEAAGLSAVFISEVESAKKAASVDSIERIARALSVPAWTLLRDE